MEICGAESAEFELFNAGHPCGHFMQSGAWARVKREWTREIVLSRAEDGTVRGGMSVLVRRMPLFGMSLLYCARGPVADLCDAETLTDIFSAIPVLAKKHRAYKFICDPAVPRTDTAFGDFALSQGFTPPPDNLNFEDTQPRFVFLLDIAGKTEEEVFAGFHQKWRYNIRLAQKHGVVLRVFGTALPETRETLPQALEDFSRIMRVTGNRDGFSVRPKAYFARILEEMGEHARLYMAYYEGVAIAGVLPIQYGDKTWYLYGASDNAQRNKMPNYLLQWAQIRWAVAGGSRVYDFRGVSGDLDENGPHYGLYKFKKGFGGDFTEFAGEYTKTLRPLASQSIDLAMRLREKLKEAGKHA
jgi:lipid II:glycine glycyltransferase (peptidoglycan interpeptide bridge formation enzyme)